MKENKGHSQLKNTVLYLKDSIKALFTKKGILISFSGVDGAGKSTIIEKIKTRLETQYRKKVVVLRHRPSVLPIISSFIYGKKQAEKRSVAKLPRTGTNKNAISSILRFAYYLSDYIFGQFYIYLKYQIRGHVVLYDRYYFDFIHDAKRTNIILPSKLIKRLFNFVFTPHLNIFLYAPAHVILKRKQELKPETIGVLTDKYLTLFKELKHTHQKATFLSIENIDLSTTLKTIETHLNKAA